jgi:hypothetical protein
MINAHFAAALRNRLIMTHDQIPHNLTCHCHRKTTLDKYGIHLQKCTLRHNLTNDTHDYLKLVHADLIRQCGYTCHVEPAGVYQADNPDNTKRLDLLVICPDLDTGFIGIDHRVTNPITPTIEHSPPGPHNISPTHGQQIRKSESEKMLLHNKHCIQQDITFYPAVQDSYGAWGPMFKKLFNKWITKLANITHTSTSVLHNYWSQRISVALQKGIARAQFTRLGYIRSINTPTPPPDTTPHNIIIQHRWDINTKHTSSTLPPGYDISPKYP